MLTCGAQAQQAFIKLKNGQTQACVITGVTASGVGVQINGQSVTWPLALIDSVQMPAPPELAKAVTAIQAKDLPGASGLLSGVVTKYRGLPTDWAQQATGLVGAVALEVGNTIKAEMAFNDLKQLYPTTGALEAEVGFAGIAAKKKNFNEAREKIFPIIEAALKEKNIPIDKRYAYSRAFYISGVVKEFDDKKSEALEDYLLTTTVFYHDPTAVNAAQDRVDVLRKEKVTAP